MLDPTDPGAVAAAHAELPAEWFEALLDALPTPLVLLEPRSARVLFANAAADKMAGGQFPRANLSAPLLRAAAGERLRAESFEWPTEGGTLSLLVHAETLPAVEGRAPVVMVTFDDVTELANAEHIKDETVAVLDTLFFSAPVGLAFFDAELRYVRVNDALAQTNGLPAAAHIGRHVADLLPEMDPAVEPALRRVLDTGEPVVDVEVVGRTPAVPGQDRHWVVSYYPVRHRSGVTLGVGAVLVEVTDRVRLLESERRARERAERAERRSAFLARAGEALNSSLDYEETLRQLAELAVPAKADWCAIDMRGVGGIGLQRLAVRHVDPDKERLGRELFERWPPRPDDAEGVWWVLRTGRPVLYREVTPELIESVAYDREHLDVSLALGLRSAMIVPLRARGEVVGAMTFVLAESGGSYGDEDLQLAMEVARSASAAIENSVLHDQVRYIARTLQTSLLPSRLPEIPGFELAARYRAAGEGFEVGGDFYDVFQRHERSWAIALGDVVGKGPEAAALTALARYSTRAAAIEHPEPARVLELLNEAILRESRVDRYMTAVHATLELVDPPRLVISSAGHPPALLLRGGTATEIGGGGRMLGIDASVGAVEARVLLEPGDAVVLYTDGVTDAAAPERILGVQDLCGALASAAGEPADEIAAALERHALLGTSGHARDDIAIVVLRYAG
jgi:PAS domain S-box-containing protein